MVRMEEIQAVMDLMSSRSARLREYEVKAEERGKDEQRSEGGLKEQILRWFVETQAPLILCDGNFPTWFHGFVSRQEAEDHLRDKALGFFLIRLSEKATGYILSYKGQDRCRHFVINQTSDGMLVVSGDSITHNSLPELIEYFRITPIQPFGECLISEKEDESPSDDLYDVVHCKPSIKLGVSVQALRRLWDQRSDVTSKSPPSLPPKSSSRKLISSTSIDRNNIVQTMPPVSKRNLPLRNSLSGGHLLHGLEQHGQTDQKWPRKMGTDEGLNQRGRTPWENEGFCSLDSQLKCCSTHGGHLSTPEGHHSNQSRSLPHLDHCSHSTNPSFPASSHPRLVPPKSASFSSSTLLFNEQSQTGLSDLPHTNLTALKPNPLYQTSSGLCAGHDSHWGPNSKLQPSRSPEIRATFTPDNTYQDIPGAQNSNTYEGLTMIEKGELFTEENNTYEDLPEVQHGGPTAQENNTYEDIPGTHNNTYASVEELQPTRQGSLGKKAHKWWKFKPESKKK